MNGTARARTDPIQTHRLVWFQCGDWIGGLVLSLLLLHVVHNHHHHHGCHAFLITNSNSNHQRAVTSTAPSSASSSSSASSTSRGRILVKLGSASATTTTATTTTEDNGSGSTASSEVPLVSFEQRLLDHLKRNDTSPICVKGYVLSKRSLGKQLVFIDFCTHNNGGDICQALLRQEYYSGDHYDGFRKCLFKGTLFEVTGVAAPTRNPGNVVLLIQSFRLLGFPRQAQHISILLRQWYDGTIPDEQVREAAVTAGCGELLQTHPPPPPASQVDPKLWFKGLAKRLLEQLPIDPNYPKAADQLEVSRRGNYAVPTAPFEYQTIPSDLLLSSLQRDFGGNNVSNDDDDDDDGDDTNRINTSSLSLRKNQTVFKLDSVAQALSSSLLLHGRADSSSSSSHTISVTGWVQNRRRFDGNITMLFLVDDLELLSSSSSSQHDDSDMEEDTAQQQQQQQQRLLCVLHPDLATAEVAGIYRNLAAVGAKLAVQGRWMVSATTTTTTTTTTTSDGPLYRGQTNSNDDRARKRVFWIQSIELVQSSSGSVTIRHLLDLLHERKMSLDQVSRALLLSSASSQNYQEETERLSLSLGDATERQWKANEFAVRLQQARQQSMRTVVHPKLIKVLEKYQYLTVKHPVEATTLDDMEHVLSSSSSSWMESTTPPAIITSSRPKSFGQALSLPNGLPGSKWASKKRPQLAWMGNQIRDVLESHPEYGRRKLEILDIGGGKGALANHLGRTMGDVHVHVVDICRGAIANGANRATRLDLPVGFTLADASSQHLNVTADVAVALHACGHLSDVALAHAVQCRAGFVVVPCCFNSNPHLTLPTTTDGPGPITVPNWLGIPEDDWAALKLLAEVQGDIPLANEAIQVICAVRAEAVCRRLKGVQEQNEVTVTVRSFPIQFSTRNTVLVGRCPRT